MEIKKKIKKIDKLVMGICVGICVSVGLIIQHFFSEVSGIGFFCGTIVGIIIVIILDSTKNNKR